MVFLGKFSDHPKFNKINKIPEYAKNYRKEYLFIRGINKEFKYFVDNINEATRGLFQNHRVVRIKKFIKRFLLKQERGKLQDTSNFEISSSDVNYLIRIEKNFLNFSQYISFCKSCYHEDDQPFIDPYPGLNDIYDDDFDLFISKFKVRYEEGTSFWDYGSDSDGYSYSDTDSDSDSDSDGFDVILPDSDGIDSDENDILLIIGDSDSDSD